VAQVGEKKFSLPPSIPTLPRLSGPFRISIRIPGVLDSLTRAVNGYVITMATMPFSFPYSPSLCIARHTTLLCSFSLLPALFLPPYDPSFRGPAFARQRPPPPAIVPRTIHTDVYLQVVDTPSLEAGDVSRRTSYMSAFFIVEPQPAPPFPFCLCILCEHSFPYIPVSILVLPSACLVCYGFSAIVDLPTREKHPQEGHFSPF